MTFRKIAIWLGIVIGAVYFSSLEGSYHFDDSHSVESNLAIRSMSNIPSFWTDGKTSSFIPENRVYRPLVYTFYSVCWAIGGGKTWPFHVMKITMHWLVALALFLIWRRLWQEPGWWPVKDLTVKFPFIKTPVAITPESGAFLIAVLFGIHPAGSECVDYIAATTSLQAAMFYVWAFYSFLKFRDSRNPSHLMMSIFLYFLSVASKEEGITLPAMVLVTEFLLHRSGKKSAPKAEPFSKRLKAALKVSAPFWAFGILMAVWILGMRPAEGHESRGYATSFEYFITQWRAYLWYMRLWFWPWDFNADDAAMEFSRSLTEPLVIQAAIGNLFVVALAWGNRKRYPALLFGLIWFYVTIAPASSVVVLAEAINEHRMYLSYVGFVGGTFVVLLHLAELAFGAEKRAAKLGFLYVAIALGLTIGTQERNRVWRTDENLWLDTVEKNPTSGRAMNNLALVYMGRGEYEKVIPLLDKCERHWGTYMYCSLNKAISYHALGNAAEKNGKRDEAAKNFDFAEKSLQRAYQLNPKNVHVNFHLGRFSEEIHKDYEKAAEYYRISINLTGNRYPAAEVRLASVLSKLNRWDEASKALDRAIALEPQNEGIFFDQGRMALEAGRLDEAVFAYRKLVERNPSHLQGWYNLGVSLLKKSDIAEARKAFEKTVALDPKSEQGLYNLSFVCEKLTDSACAIDAISRLAQQTGKQEYKIRLDEMKKRYGVQ